MSRILGLDIGQKRIGVAISDETQLIASPLTVLQSKGWGPDCAAILQLMHETGACAIVCGLPLNMNGSEGFQAQRIRDFAAQLIQRGCDVRFEDERLSTVTAEDALIEGNVRRNDRKKYVDKIAAAVILQQYLDGREKSAPSKEEADMTEEMNNNVPENEEEFDDIIELEDEDGVTGQYRILCTLENNGKLYAALEVLEGEASDDDNGEDSESEVVFMEICTDENNEDYYVAVDDEELSEELFNSFLDLMDEAGEEE